MKKIESYQIKYINWLISLSKTKFIIIGLIFLAFFALGVQIIISLVFIGTIHLPDLGRSIVFGLISAPFAIYFIALIIERINRSVDMLTLNVEKLDKEIIKRKKAQQELEESLHEIEVISKKKTDLMTIISHELRTPLNGIVGLSRILLDQETDLKHRNYLGTIHMSAIALGHIFNDIIDLEKVNFKKLELNPKVTNLYHFLANITMLGNLMAKQKDLIFKAVYLTDLPTMVYIDQTKLSQILWNLINNAVKFTSQGGIYLYVSCKNPQDPIPNISFEVVDTGIGIDKEYVEKIFDIYYQIPTETKSKQGSGIGLAISFEIAKLMGGALKVNSSKSKGSTFHFCINAPIANESHKTNNLAALNGLKVLLIEDIEVNVIVAKAVLEKFNFKVDVALDGKSAIDLFSKNNYDFLLIDIQLPDMTGFEVAQNLTDMYNSEKIDYLPPLIALTANVVKDKEHYKQNYMDDVIGKPLSVTALSRSLSKIFNLEYTSEYIEETKDNIINTSFINELKSILSLDLIKENIDIFERSMNGYLDELNQALKLYQQDNSHKEVGKIAHKIKSSCSSVGLLRLQTIASQAQQTDSDDYAEKITKYVEQINQLWSKDLDYLRKYIETI